MDPWILSATEPTAGFLYLANGYLGTSLHWDGGLLFESEASPCYVRGVYSDAGTGGIDRLAAIPCWNRLRYDTPAHVREYRRHLNLREGILHTYLLLEEERGQIAIEQEILVSRADPHLAVVALRLIPHFDGPITCLAGMDAPLGGDAAVMAAEADAGRLALTCRIRRYDVEVIEELTFEADGWDWSGSASQMAVSAHLTHEGKRGSPIELSQLARLVTSLDSSSLQLGEGSPGVDRRQARRDHVAAWEKLWETRIEIEGDPEAQQFANAGLFYLWSTMRPDDCWSIAPMGLSSNGYNGHIFWDAELWMYPTLLVTQPGLAASCVAYRERTIEAARQRAAANGCRGAQFPWEGAYTGEEMTPEWAETRDFQLHITADVALGQWWYYLNTGDLEWLRQHGYPVIRECAEFWISRVEHNTAADRFEISDVVCADEYAAHVDNDAFTNAAVRSCLLIAARAAELLGETPRPEWSAVAERMYVPYDAASRRHLEFDGYDGRVTKQADVELLAYPLEYVTDGEQIARDLDYYSTVIDPDGPAMSFSVYAILSAQLGRAEEAYQYFRRSYEPNTRPPFHAFSETPTNNEFFFCTGVGGALQGLLFGFTGLRLREGYFALNPILPPKWTALRFRQLYVSSMRTDIEIERESLTIRRHLPQGMLELHIPHRDRPTVSCRWDGRPGAQLLLAVDDGNGHAFREQIGPNQAVDLPVACDGQRIVVSADGEAPALDFFLRTERA